MTDYVKPQSQEYKSKPNQFKITYSDLLVSVCHCCYFCFYLQGEIPWLDKGSSYLENCKTSSPPRHHLLLPKYLFLLEYEPPRWMYFEKIIVTHGTFFKLTSYNYPSSSLEVTKESWSFRKDLKHICMFIFSLHMENLRK